MKNKRVQIQDCVIQIVSVAMAEGGRGRGTGRGTLVLAAHQASGSLHPSAVSDGFGQEAEEGFSGKGLHSTAAIV